MPVDAFVDERHLPPLGLSNAWGYNPVVLGAPDPRLAPGGWARGARARPTPCTPPVSKSCSTSCSTTTARATSSGRRCRSAASTTPPISASCPTIRRRYVNDTGCGNCLALDRPPVVAMAVAALRRWMALGGFDGFRFDLAAAIGRRDWGFDEQAPLFQALATDPDPVAGQADRRAVGSSAPEAIGSAIFPTAGASGTTASATPRAVSGAASRALAANSRPASPARATSSPTRLRPPRASTSSSPTTASPSPMSSPTPTSTTTPTAKTIATGPTTTTRGTTASKARPTIPRSSPRARATCAICWRCPVLARGAPMLAMGAELGHSQNGNNNAYAQDNAITWIDWAKADASLIAFAGRLAQIRRAHPALSRPVWLNGAPVGEGGPLDVEWRDAEGPLTQAAQWEAAGGDVLVVGFAGAHGQRRRPRRSSPSIAARTPFGCACPTRARTSSGASCSTPATMPSSTPRRRSPTACASPAARRCSLAEVDAPTPRLRAPTAREVEALAEAAGIAGEWWDVAGGAPSSRPRDQARPAGGFAPSRATQAQARESLARLVDETRARAPADRPTQPPRRAARSCRCAPTRPSRRGRSTATILTEDGARARVPRRAGRSGPHRARRRARRSSNG